MTVIWSESFDLFGNLNDYAAKYSEHTTSPGGFNTSSWFNVATGRFGSGSAANFGGATGSGSATSYSYVGGSLGSDYPTLFFGFAINPRAVDTGGYPFFWANDRSGNLEIEIRLTGAGNLTPYVTSNSTVLCTSTTALTMLNWTYIELAVNISPTAGWCELWMNNVLTASYYGVGSSRGSATGNVVGGLSSGIRTFHIGEYPKGSSAGTHDYYFDDLYVCNNVGSINTDLLGDVRVASLLPSGAGALNDWSRGGTDSGANYSQVDEGAYNADTDYVRSNTIGATDTYVYPDLPAAAASVKAVVAQFVGRRDDAGARSVQAVVRQSGTNSLSPGVANMSASYTSAQLVMDVNPATGLAWNVSEVNGDEFGLRISA